jgi:hypothetical protein
VVTPHPSELFGEDWMSWGRDAREADAAEEPVHSKMARANAAADGPDELAIRQPIG